MFKFSWWLSHTTDGRRSLSSPPLYLFVSHHCCWCFTFFLSPWLFCLHLNASSKQCRVPPQPPLGTGRVLTVVLATWALKQLATGAGVTTAEAGVARALASVRHSWPGRLEELRRWVELGSREDETRTRFDRTRRAEEAYLTSL